MGGEGIGSTCHIQLCGRLFSHKSSLTLLSAQTKWLLVSCKKTGKEEEVCRGNREMARVLLLTKPSGRFFPLTKMASCKGKAYKRDRGEEVCRGRRKWSCWAGFLRREQVTSSPHTSSGCSQQVSYCTSCTTVHKEIIWHIIHLHAYL